MNFSIIVPVYNRPDELNELLESLVQQSYSKPFEVVIVEDGSTQKSEHIVAQYKDKLSISYYFKDNSGPGDSRNFGMKQAKGDYYIIFDSDCIIPPQYLDEVEKQLNEQFVECFGGSDAALDSFTNVQKAINFAMTSFLTTGGIRGGSEKVTKFQPRSFNMGISKKAFIASNGFGNIHPGEDPDLSIRLWKMGYKTRLFTQAFVYHKRRIDWKKFSIQVNKFGKARPILDCWYPEYSKLTFFFPSIFIMLFFFSVVLLFFKIYLPIGCFAFYFLTIWVSASLQYNNAMIGWLAVIATFKQFFGYGSGFLLSFFKVRLLNQEPQKAFPELFFKVQS